MAKRKIMRRFQINEISGVDEPAQEGAVMTLMKNNAGHPIRYKIPDDAFESITDKLIEVWERAGLGDASSVIGEIEAAWAMAYPHKAPADMPDEETSTEDDEEEADMAKHDDQDERIEVTEDELAMALARGHGCAIDDAYKAIASAEEAGEEAVQKLFTPQVMAALATEDGKAERDAINGAVSKRVDVIVKTNETSTKPNKQPYTTALREMFREDPSQFGH